jgi:hypothetical protein
MMRQAPQTNRPDEFIKRLIVRSNLVVMLEPAYRHFAVTVFPARPEPGHPVRGRWPHEI